MSHVTAGICHTFVCGVNDGLTAIRSTAGTHKAATEGSLALLRAVCTGPAHAEPTEVMATTMSMLASASASHVIQKTRETTIHG